MDVVDRVLEKLQPKIACGVEFEFGSPSRLRVPCLLEKTRDPFPPRTHHENRLAQRTVSGGVPLRSPHLARGGVSGQDRKLVRPFQDWSWHTELNVKIRRMHWLKLAAPLLWRSGVCRVHLSLVSRTGFPWASEPQLRLDVPFLCGGLLIRPSLVEGVLGVWGVDAK